jgi:membrane-bound lytic murein transglycosylase D
MGFDKPIQARENPFQEFLRALRSSNRSYLLWFFLFLGLLLAAEAKAAPEGPLTSAVLPSPLTINPPEEKTDPPQQPAPPAQKAGDEKNGDKGSKDPDVKTDEEGLVMVSPSPLEEIDEEDDNVPDDFFDIDALLEPPISPLPPEITYDVPIDVNEDVNNYIILFQTRMRDKFELWLSRSGKYIDSMKEIFRRNELPEDLVFLALVESGFNPYAYSRSRAVGPWQFMRGTARKYGLKVNRWVDERRDPIKSTAAAARYLKDLFDMFNSWPLSLASYNAGEGRVMRALNKSKIKVESFWDLRNSRYLRRETKHYVPKFMAATIIAKNPTKYGFDLEYKDPLAFDEVEVHQQVSLKTAAKAAGSTYDVMKELNPELRRGVTPPHTSSYLLRIPPGTKETFQKNFSEMPAKQIRRELRVLPEVTVRRHRIRRGESLSRVAHRYRTSISKILELNHLSDPDKIVAGQILLIPTRVSD